MSTTWGQNTWGSNSWESNQNFAIPSGNTISISSSTALAYPEQGWGGKQWSINEWGELTDVTVYPTGSQAQTSIGNETAEGILNVGWGRKNYGEEAWGIGGSAIAPSYLLNLTLESVSVTNEINIGWGGLAWGVGEWGDLANPDVLVSGTQITASLETPDIKADANVDVTGVQSGLTQGESVGGTSVLIVPNGQELSSEISNVFGGELVTVEVTSPSNDEWGTDYWGAGQFGVGDGITIITAEPTLVGTANIELTSNQLSISEGTVDPAPDATVTGVGMTIASAVGTVTADGSVNVTGLQNTASTETPTVIGTANIEVTGNQITGQTGQLEYEAKYLIGSVESSTQIGDAFGGELVEVQVTTASAQPWGYTPFGSGQYGQGIGTDIEIGGEEVAIPSQEVDVTAVTATTFVQEVSIVADANVTVTQLPQTLALLGAEDAFTNVRVNVTGEELGPIIIGDYLAGISITAEPTGVTSTVSTGIMGVNAWAVVDPDLSTTWSVVDIAA